MIPSLKSLLYLTISTILQLLGLIIAIPTTIMVLNTESMYLYEYDNQLATSLRVDVTIYIHIVTCITLLFHCMGFILAFTNCAFAYNGLSRLTNRVGRRSQNHLDQIFMQTLPDSVLQKEIQCVRG